VPLTPLLLPLLLFGAAPPSSPLIDAATVVPGLQVALAYSTSDNFLGKDVYGDLETCFLQPVAAEQLRQAAVALSASHPALHLYAYDCARPVRVQQQMWEVVKGTPQQGFVADPATGSVHNLGCAVDIGLADQHGPIDMGTTFDFFGEAAGPRHERKLLLSGALSAAQVANRLILREVMVRAGYLPLDHEWWHFDCMAGAEARRQFQPMP
jgi:zinc D-Ala-D-Ala dipeptidase